MSSAYLSTSFIDRGPQLQVGSPHPSSDIWSEIKLLVFKVAVLYVFLTVQEELEQPQPGVCCHGNQVKSSLELQRHHEQLVLSLKDLLALGRERLAAGPEDELRDRARLAQRHSGHMVSLSGSASQPRRWEHIKAPKGASKCLCCSEVLPVPGPSFQDSAVPEQGSSGERPLEAGGGVGRSAGGARSAVAARVRKGDHDGANTAGTK